MTVTLDLPELVGARIKDIPVGEAFDALEARLKGNKGTP